jgi:hypothetical protein
MRTTVGMGQDVIGLPPVARPDSAAADMTSARRAFKDSRSLVGREVAARVASLAIYAMAFLSLLMKASEAPSQSSSRAGELRFVHVSAYQQQ